MIENNMLVSELTIDQFAGFICGVIVIILFFLVLSYVLCQITGFIIDVIKHKVICKKYRNPREIVNIITYRYLRRLRKQVESATTEKEFFLYYNRFIGALGLCLELNLITSEQSGKILLSIRGKFEFNKIRNKYYEE